MIVETLRVYVSKTKDMKGYDFFLEVPFIVITLLTRLIPESYYLQGRCLINFHLITSSNLTKDEYVVF